MLLPLYNFPPRLLLLMGIHGFNYEDLTQYLKLSFFLGLVCLWITKSFGERERETERVGDKEIRRQWGERERETVVKLQLGIMCLLYKMRHIFA